MKKILLILGGCLLLCSLILISTELRLKYQERYAPKFQDVKRKTFEKTKSYKEGKKQELIKYLFEYKKSTDAQEKEALKFVIRNQFADYDYSNLPYNLQIELKEILK
jgi:hypothetical protein